jgi:hypothetical protein
MSRPTDSFTGPLVYASKRVRDRDAEQHQSSIRGEFSAGSEPTEPLTPDDEWLKRWISERRAVAAGGSRRRIWFQLIWLVATGAVVILVGAGSFSGRLVTAKLSEVLGIVAKDDRSDAASFENRFRIQNSTVKAAPSFETERLETSPVELRRLSDVSTAQENAMGIASLEQEARPGEPLQAGPAKETEQRREGRRPLDADQAAVFLKRGQDLIANGDIVAARVILLRLAEARDARGALELAATFDPIVLKKIGVMGVAADLSSARYWYRKAEEFGSEEASTRLKLLAGM